MGLLFGVAWAAASAPAWASSYQILYSFRSGGGSLPEAALINVDGTLYGTTTGGGFAGSGTVFSLDSLIGPEEVLHSFFSDGGSASPTTELINVGDKLFGTTTTGGGTVFSLNVTTGAFKIGHSFGYGRDGENFESGLIKVGGLLYGTTAVVGGQTTNCTGCGGGTLARSTHRTERVVYRFRGGDDGAEPQADPTDVGGNLYGSTYYGGSLNDGTIFSLDPTTGIEQVIQSFAGGNDGANPRAGLINVTGQRLAPVPIREAATDMAAAPCSCWT